MPAKCKGKKAAPKSKKAATKGKKSSKAPNTHAEEEDDEVEIVKVAERQKTGFLDLATEIRNQVYLLALVRGSDANSDAPPVVIHKPAILATCRQVRADAMAVFYGGNTCSAKFALYGPKIVKQLGPERIAMLTALKPCGVESARFVTYDRFMHATVKHVNRLFEAAWSSLTTNAVLMPIDHAAASGCRKLSEMANVRIGEADGVPFVEWVGVSLQPAFSVYER